MKIAEPQTISDNLQNINWFVKSISLMFSNMSTNTEQCSVVWLVIYDLQTFLQDACYKDKVDRCGEWWGTTFLFVTACNLSKLPVLLTNNSWDWTSTTFEIAFHPPQLMSSLNPSCHYTQSLDNPGDPWYDEDTWSVKMSQSHHAMSSSHQSRVSWLNIEKQSANEPCQYTIIQ